MAPVEACRAPSCDLNATTELGFCPACHAVYDAAVGLTQARRAAQVARIAASFPELGRQLTPANRIALLEHLAANAEQHGFRLADGIADFLAELAEAHRPGGVSA